MKLSAASRFFDRTVARDAYSPRSSFKCQLEPLDLYRMDGTRIKIRGMSTAPGLKIPARRVIEIDGQRYLVSDASSDQWAGEPVRDRYVIQGADYSVQIRTIPQVLDDAAGTTAYGSIDFNKYSTDERDSSEYHPQYHIFFGGTEIVEENYILTADGRSYLVKNAHRTTAGLKDALANLLDDPVIDAASFVSRAYNPITDTYTDTSTTVRCIRVRWQEHFNYLSQGSRKFERADMVVLMPLSVTPKAGDRVEIGGTPWEILSVVDRTGYQSLHIRRA